MNSVTASGQDDEFNQWLLTPPGQYLLAWEQAQLDRAVSNIFGFHALQLGVPALRGLRANRMQHRWLAMDAELGHALQSGDAPTAEPSGPVDQAQSLPLAAPTDAEAMAMAKRIDLRCHFDGLPIKSQSLDLVVLPHTLELTRDPHQTLREVERVLMPDGRLIISGFNSASLWGMRQRAGHLRQRLGGQSPLYLPRSGEFIGYRRLRDWLRLLSIDIEGGRFGCYALPVQSQSWLQRCAWMDKTGDRWWPVFGSVYFIVAVKRVRGMRLVGLAKKTPSKGTSAPAVVTHRMPSSTHDEQN